MAPNTIETITRSGLQDLKLSDDACITDVKSVSSYSWIEAPTPTIAVPGSPSLWSPPAVRIQPPKDSGIYNIGENARRIPSSPMAPLFRALFTTNPSFDLRSIDVISDRHNIRKLLSFVDPVSDRDKGESFTIKLELVRNTLLMCRSETNVSHSMGPYSFRGYGHEFEKVCTVKGILSSTSHHRIISYDFCGLKFMIRHEIVAYVSPETDAIARLETGIPPDPECQVSLGNKVSKAKRDPDMVTIMLRGKTIPLMSTLDIKTRSLTRPERFAEVAPKLWVSQTPKFVQAFHLRGQFGTPGVRDVRAGIREWERDNQKNLRTLGALIGKIITVMKECEGRAILRYDVSSASLIISRDEGDSGMLPADLYSKWDE
ncbi:hypothetical protein E4U39_006335 [Claviceps sp. Clav50 group G5]|nr:hypothetical protein E4U39_006335 [Claviceps sp. Clav50 group G5]